MNFYKNGNYVVCIADDGTKIRSTKDNEFIPDFAENCDVKITDKCDGRCPFCYEGCTENGKHADLFSYKFIETLHPYTELALNGNDLSHPQIEDFLKFLKEKKVYANLTVNQKHFMLYFNKLKNWTDEKLIYGLGVSLNNVNAEFIEKVKQFPNAVIHTINGILDKESIEKLANNNLKVLILGYKDLRRGISYKETHSSIIKDNQKMLYENLKQIIDNKMFDVVSFDNLAITQLDVKRLFDNNDDWDRFYMGDDGNFTFYIDMVDGYYSKNSLSQERYKIGEKTIDEMFKHILKENESTN